MRPWQAAQNEQLSDCFPQEMLQASLATKKAHVEEVYLSALCGVWRHTNEERSGFLPQMSCRVPFGMRSCFELLLYGLSPRYLAQTVGNTGIYELEYTFLAGYPTLLGRSDILCVLKKFFC